MEYGKGRLVLAVIKEYLDDTDSSYSEIQDAFPDNLQGGGVGVLISDEKLKQKLQQSNDTKNRFFVDSPITAGDGKVFYVSSQWRITNIGKFIVRARDLGYSIVNVDFKTHYDAYKEHPADHWIPDYRKVCNKYSEYKSKPALEYDDNFLELIWLKPNNRVSSVKPGFLSQKEYENIKDQLPEITKEIGSDPSPSMLSKVVAWAKQAKTENRLQTVKYGVIRRVFAAANPEQYSTITRESNQDNLINELKNRFGLVVESKGNWADKNMALMKSIKAEGLQNEDIYLVNTFVWELYKKYVLDKTVVPDPSSDPDLKPITKAIKTIGKEPKNCILYGPPGTGKTYHTINSALRIIDPAFYNEYENSRAELKKHFDKLTNDGRIGFVTFHQSFSYEDFVEGIRAETDNGAISYSIQDGIFKELCQNAVSNEENGNIDDVLVKLIEYLQDGSLHLRTSTGKGFSLGYSGGRTFTVKPDASASNGEYHASIENIKKVYRGAKAGSIYNASYVFSILEHLKDKYQLAAEPVAESNSPVVLIIDEINRGNTANIFGELITLIEPSKRAGMEEALEVILPYSKEKFSVPNNLYIIGTMNTADRSLSMLDTALRRRFKFIEMSPKANLLDGAHIESIDIKKIFEAINNRISILYDRDHMIGHSYFLPLLDSDATFSRLKDIFSNEIIPLLEEYFFEDWEKIGKVLGDAKKSKNLQMIIPTMSEDEVVSLFGEDENGAMNIQYMRNVEAMNNPQAYIAIYNNF